MVKFCWPIYVYCASDGIHLIHYIQNIQSKSSSAMESHNTQREDSESDQNDTNEVAHLLSLPDTNICDVWASNFEEEMKKLMKLTERFNVIAMDTEFPGIFVSKEESQRFCTEEQNEYYLIRRNVEETKLIQIGLTIADEEGNVPEPVCTWQFNFRFDIQKENIVNQSADLLKKAGVQFERLKSEGIDYLDFAEYLQASGFVYNRKVKWVVFHGSSDFAYLLRLVHNMQLPSSIDQFYRELKKYFPNIYDLKYIIRDVPALKDVGLAKLSYQIGCNRIGPQHQAGSDSLLTLCCYYKMRQQNQVFSHTQFETSLNIIFGIGTGYLKNTLNGYHRQYESSYMSHDYYDERAYYDNSRVYMNQMQGYNQMYGNGGGQGHGHGHGALYTYLNHHNGYMMYSHDQQHSQQHQQHQQHQGGRY